MSSNECELDQKRSKRLSKGRNACNQTDIYKQRNESMLLSVPGSFGQNLHHSYETKDPSGVNTKAVEDALTENSKLIKRLRRLCYIQREFEPSRNDSNLESLERIYIIHRKRMQLVELLHNARVRDIVESNNSYICRLVNGLNQRHQQYVVTEVNIE